MDSLRADSSLLKGTTPPQSGSDFLPAIPVQFPAIFAFPAILFISFKAAHPAACATLDTLQGCRFLSIFSSSSKLDVIPYPSRIPGIAEIFVKACRIIRFLLLSHSLQSVCFCGSDRNSTKHSSKIMRIPFSSHVFKISSRKSFGITAPLGLSGEHKKSRSTSSFKNSR